MFLDKQTTLANQPFVSEVVHKHLLPSQMELMLSISHRIWTLRSMLAEREGKKKVLSSF